MQTYEVEVKVLLGSVQEVLRVVELLKKRNPECHVKAQSNQLNHYFTAGGDFEKMKTRIAPYITEKERQSLKHLLSVGKKHSVRTRDADGTIILVVKADKSAAADSMHGNMRYEWEAVIKQKSPPEADQPWAEKVPPSSRLRRASKSQKYISKIKYTNYQQPTTNNVQSIDDLDSLILSCGFEFLSKWSRQRKEYHYKDMTVCIDKNAGYGYLAEFEKVVNDERETDSAKERIKNELKTLDLKELSQDRLGRMFAYYNSHWKEYYRTEKVFTVA